LQAWPDTHPPGPAHAIDCPGTQLGAPEPPSAADPQRQGPYPAPSAAQTWLDAHPPGPTHALDCPGTHADAPASDGGAHEQEP
jgi:hypothetical protein